MVTCTPTKKARIMQLRKQGWKFKDIGNEIGLESSVVSRNYNKLIKKGPHPDLYHHEPIPGRPKIITPHAERRAVRLITSGECRDATDVQRVLFPRLHPTTVRQMFIRKGMPGRIRKKSRGCPGSISLNGICGRSLIIEDENFFGAKCGTPTRKNSISLGQMGSNTVEEDLARSFWREMCER